jgi:hypothetical protein
VAVGSVVVGSLFLAVVGTSTDVVQRRVPSIGRWPFVEDQDFRVVEGPALDQLEAQFRDLEAERIEANETGPSAIGFEEIKPRVEAYLEEGRNLWIELADRPLPDRVGVLYDRAVDWQKRVIADLSPYHDALATEFRLGGNILSPRLDDVAPTDCANLQVCVERRGQVLRNFLDGTPGTGLAWGENIF